MVMHATYYNTLVGKVVLYHVKVTLDFWEEASYYDEDAKHDIIVGFLANEVYWKASKKV
jgi:hypothetical protein